MAMVHVLRCSSNTVGMRTVHGLVVAVHALRPKDMLSAHSVCRGDRECSLTIEHVLWTQDVYERHSTWAMATVHVLLY